MKVKHKFSLAIIFAIIWTSLSIWLAIPWYTDMVHFLGFWLSLVIIVGIAIIPGCMNAFIVASLFLDRRPPRTQFPDYPDVTILVAAYNEESGIVNTIESIAAQSYPGGIRALILDDGSTDRTADMVAPFVEKYPWLELVSDKKNHGKSHVLNVGLGMTKTDLVITVDGDCELHYHAILHIVERYMSDPDETVAVAGAVLIKNHNASWATRVQEWDYFLGIGAIKRIQSFYHGTLVAQGAFSLYETDALREVDGWPHCVGEDIVVSWALLKDGHRIGFAEDAVVFTNAPETWKQFIRQRHRWSRGLIEAFKEHWHLLFKLRLSMIYIWWNVAFPYLDLAYTLAFIPGVILALFGHYWIAGPLTLLLLPMALVINWIIYSAQTKTFVEYEIEPSNNIWSFMFYSFFYSIILQPACVVGYFKEVLYGSVKNWGTK